MLERGITAGELPEQNVSLTAAAIVGACGEALVGPLSPLGDARPGAEEVVRFAAHVRAAGGRRRVAGCRPRSGAVAVSSTTRPTRSGLSATAR